MEVLWDKIGVIIASLITAMGGFYMYDRKINNERITKLEKDSSQHRTDIRIIEVKFAELKEDIEEIKGSQIYIINLLTASPKRRK